MTHYKCRLCDSTIGKALVSGIKDWEYGAAGEYSYYECAGCSQIQINPFPSLQDLMNAYPSAYPAYIDDTGYTRGNFYDLLLKVHTYFRMRKIVPHIKPGAKILDVGSGNGDFLCG